jgi:hypothetical protein
MPRPRKPPQLLVVEGTLRPGRHAERAHEPTIDVPLGGPPSDWKPSGKALWWEIANAIPAGVATKADRLIVEIVCRLTVVMREEPAKFTSSMAAQLRCCLASLGMTPADRSRVSVVRPAFHDDDVERYFR